MTKHVRIADGVVQEIMVVPDGCDLADVYPESTLAQCLDAPDDVEAGWTYNGTNFSEPSLPLVQPSGPPIVSFQQLLQLFTDDEQIALAGSDDAGTKLFLLSSIASNNINLGEAKSKSALANLVSQKLLTQSRATAILAGNAI